MLKEINYERSTLEVPQRALDIERIENLPFSPEDREYLLPDVDFQMGLHLSKYMQAVRNGDRDTFLDQAESDLRGYAIEYLARSPVISFAYEIDMKNGSPRVTSPQYGNEDIRDNVSGLERGGAAKHANNALAEYFIHAPVGSVFVATSPPGWSGYEDEYKTSQTYVFQKTTLRDVEALTLRSNMSLEDNEAFLAELLGVDWPYFGSEKERIKAVTETVVLARESAGAEAVVEIAEYIHDRIESDNFLHETMDEGGEYEKCFSYSLDDVLYLLENKDKVLASVSATDGVIAEYCKWVRENINGSTDEELIALAVETGKTVLRLLPALEGKSADELQSMTKNEFAKIRAVQATMTGCVGGGVGRKKGREGEVIHCVFCPVCRQSVSVKIVSGKMVCMNCGASKG